MITNRLCCAPCRVCVGTASPDCPVVTNAVHLTEDSEYQPHTTAALHGRSKTLENSVNFHIIQHILVFDMEIYSLSF